MGIVVRQSFKASIVSYIGAVIGYVNIMFITPYCLTPEIVGFNKVLLDAAIVFTFLAQLGLNSAMVRFFPYFKDGLSNRGFLSLIVFIPLVGFVLLCGVVAIFYAPIVGLFKANSALFSNNFQYVLPLTFFMMYLGLLETYSACLMRIVVPKIIREVLLRIFNIGLIIIFFLKVINFQQFVISIIVIHAIAVALNFYYLSKISKLSIKPQFTDVPKPVFRNFFYYVVFIFFVGIGSNIVGKVDTYMISTMINLSNTGVFSIAFFIITIIEIPSRAFLQISYPVLAEAAKNNDTKTIADIYTKSSINQYIVGSVLFLLIWINVDNIFAIMPNGHIYEAGKFVILFMGLSKLFDMVTGANWLIIANSKHYYNQIIFMVYVSAASIFFNSIFIPKYGIVGAGIASLIALGSYNIILLFYLRIKMKLWPLTRQTAIFTGMLLLMFGANFLLPVVKNPYFDAIYRTVIVSVLFMALIYFGKVSADINQLINGFSLKDLKNYLPKKLK